VIDTAGAIYVLGGDGDAFYRDVYVSTDGGARPESVGGSSSTGWVLGGY
jgi:hypothetical protein